MLVAKDRFGRKRGMVPRPMVDGFDSIRSAFYRLQLSSEVRFTRIAIGSLSQDGMIRDASYRKKLP